MLQKAMNIVVGPLQHCDLTGFYVIIRALVEWRCEKLLVSYRYDIHDNKDISLS